MLRPDDLSLPTDISDKPFIFISYARRDSHFIYPEIKRLQRNGYRIWYDMADIPAASNWAEETDKAIRACSCFVVFITPGAIESNYVSYEKRKALNVEKPYVRIDLEKLKLPPSLQSQVHGTQAVERYLLYQSEYERQLRRSLSEYVGQPTRDGSATQTTGLSWQAVRSFSVLFAVVFFFLAAVMTWLSTSTTPGGSPANHLVGIFGGVCITFSLLLCVAALAVNHKYLSRRRANITPHNRYARTVVLLCYSAAGFVLLAGAFFALAAASLEMPEPPLNRVSPPMLAALMSGPFLIFATLLILFGWRVQNLYRQRHEPEKIVAQIAVGCLRLGSIGCGLWLILSACTTLLMGTILITGEPAGIRQVIIGSSGPVLAIFLMLIVAWFISASYLRNKSKKLGRAYRAYLDDIRPRLHMLAEPETLASLQQSTMEVLGKLDATLKSALLIFLGESGLLEGHARIILKDADFRYVNLPSNSLPRAILRGIDLGQAMLPGCILFEADLRNAKLNSADLSYANLQGANLRQADLTEAVLEKTNLSGADLTEAKLTLHQLRQARLDNTVLPDGTVTTPDLDLNGISLNQV